MTQYIENREIFRKIKKNTTTTITPLHFHCRILQHHCRKIQRDTTGQRCLGTPLSRSVPLFCKLLKFKNLQRDITFLLCLGRQRDKYYIIYLSRCSLQRQSNIIREIIKKKELKSGLGKLANGENFWRTEKIFA
jgi:hypothetical protein